MFLPVVTHAANPTPKQLAGKWSCVTEYPKINVVTRDINHYDVNGNIHIKGRFEFAEPFTSSPLNVNAIDFNHLLVYIMPFQGKWTLNNNLLTLNLKAGKPQAVHGDKIKQDMKKGGFIRELDSMNSSILLLIKQNKLIRDNMDSNPVIKQNEQYFFRIDEITPKRMMQTQLESAKTDAKEMAKSVCTRL